MRTSELVCFALGTGVATAILTACAGSWMVQEGSGVGAQMQRVQPEAVRPLTFAPRASLLYAADCCGLFNNGDVNVYPTTLKRVDRRLIRGGGNSVAIAVDHAGTLYSLDSGSGFFTGIAVIEWDLGAKEPSRKVKGFVWADAIAVDNSSNLYVADCNTCPDGDLPLTKVHDEIFIYEARQTKVRLTITKGLHSPRSIAVDADGYLYVANVPNSSSSPKRRPSIAVYAPGSTTPLSVVSPPHGNTNNLALLTINNKGDLFLEDGGGEVLEYSPRLGKLLRTITDQVYNPTGLAFDASDRLYIANTYQYPAKGTISVYASGSSKSSYVIRDEINDPVALAVSSAGELYVANDEWGTNHNNGYITLYRPGARKPLRSINGGRFGWPTALALDSF